MHSHHLPKFPLILRAIGAGYSPRNADQSPGLSLGAPERHKYTTGKDQEWPDKLARRTTRKGGRWRSMNLSDSRRKRAEFNAFQKGPTCPKKEICTGQQYSRSPGDGKDASSQRLRVSSPKTFAVDSEQALESVPPKEGRCPPNECYCVYRC